MRGRNPFKPTAGATPPLLVGRETQLDDFEEAVENGPGAPGLLSLVTGARGVGKTVMLSELGDVARRHGWVVVDETATRSVLGRVQDAVDRMRAELGRPDRRSVSHVQLSPVAVSLVGAAASRRTWRDSLSQLLDLTEAEETGVLITVDEVHAMARSELAALAADVQHLIRESRAIGLVMAGLPSAVEDLLNENVSTFLRRAERMHLDDVPIDLVRVSLGETLEAGSVQIDPVDLDRAAAATEGYPFMIQLVGYQLWRRADVTGVITHEQTELALDAARVRLGSLVHAPALADLSDVDRTVLIAMARHDGPSRLGELAQAVGRDSSYLSVYRERLIKAGMVQSAGYGLIDFAMPYLRDYLRQHATALVRRVD